MMTLLVGLALAQTMNLNQIGIIVKDEGVQQGSTRATTINCTGAGVSCTNSSGTMTVSVAGGGGGGGSGNFVEDTVTFSGGSDATKTITVAWASASSVLLCSASGEEASVEGLQVVVTARAAGSFTVRGYVLQGTHTGALTIHCTGN